MYPNFQKEPLKMFSVGLTHYVSNKQMPDDLKELIKNSIHYLNAVPEGEVIKSAEPFFEVNVMEHDLQDLVDCGLYEIIYSIALATITGRPNGETD